MLADLPGRLVCVCLFELLLSLKGTRATTIFLPVAGQVCSFVLQHAVGNVEKAELAPGKASSWRAP